MRITKLMGLAVTIVAMAVVINTLALSTAEVRNPVTVSVVNTTSALISLSAPASPDNDLTIDTAATGVYTLTVEEGVQPNSTYVFGNTIQITNRSDDTVKVKYDFGTLPTNMTMVLKNVADNVDINTANTNTGVSLTPNGGTVTLYLQIATADDTPTGAVNPTLKITATKQ